MEPTNQLGVMTINHLAKCYKIDVPELTELTSSAWIVHDTLQAVERCDNAWYKALTATRLQRMADDKNMPAVLYGLRPYLPEGDEDGKS